MDPDIVLFYAFMVLPLLCGCFLYLFFVRYRLHEGARWRGLRLAFGNLLVLLLLLSLALLVGEAYYRFVYDTTDASALTKTTHDWAKRHYQRNSWGMRDSIDYADQIPPGQRRVTFLGDSFTAGLGVSDVDGRFVNLIRAGRPAWDIHMLADYGWETEAELVNPHLKRTGYELDLVALVYCLNDAADLNAELNAYVSSEAKSAPRRGLLVQHSYLLDQLYWRAVERRIDPERYLKLMISGYEGPLWEAQVARLRCLRDLIQGRGGRLVVITFPFFNYPWPTYPYAGVHRALEAVWAALDVPHLDLLPIYLEHPPERLVINARDAHPNEYAHALAAKAILPLLDHELHSKLHGDSPLSKSTPPTSPR